MGTLAVLGSGYNGSTVPALPMVWKRQNGMERSATVRSGRAAYVAYHLPFCQFAAVDRRP